MTPSAVKRYLDCMNMKLERTSHIALESDNSKEILNNYQTTEAIN